MAKFSVINYFMWPIFVSCFATKASITCELSSSCNGVPTQRIYMKRRHRYSVFEPLFRSTRKQFCRNLRCQAGVDTKADVFRPHAQFYRPARTYYTLTPTISPSTLQRIYPGRCRINSAIGSCKISGTFCNPLSTRSTLHRTVPQPQ
jgi:hypothetical protein